MQIDTVRPQLIADSPNGAIVKILALTLNVFDTSTYHTHISKNIGIFRSLIENNTHRAIRFNLQIGVDVLTKDIVNYKIQNINVLQFLS